MTIRLVTAAAVVGCTLPALAGPAVSRWAVETSKPSAHLADAFQGETLWLEPTLLSYGAAVSVTNSALTLHWQTNGMGSAWWSKPAEAVPAAAGRIRAVWSPTNDVGAAQYTFYIQAADGGASNFRAYGLIRMRPSPGFSPAAAPAPSYQWASPDDLQTVSNALATALQAESAARITGDADGSNAVAAVRADLLAAEARLTLGDARRIVQADTNAWITVADGTGILWRIEQVLVQIPDTNRMVFAQPPTMAGDTFGGYVGECAIVFDISHAGNNAWTVYAQGSELARIDGAAAWAFSNPVASGSVERLSLMITPGMLHSDWGPTAKAANGGSWPADFGPGVYVMNNEFEEDNSPEALFNLSATFAWATNEVSRTVTNAYPLATQQGTVILLSDHDADPAAHSDIRAEIAAIPRFPTNYVAGTLYNDLGSNIVATVIVSNQLVTLWKVVYD